MPATFMEAPHLLLHPAAVITLKNGIRLPVYVTFIEKAEEDVIIAWCERTNPHIASQKFLQTLVEQHFTLANGDALIATIDQLEVTARALAIELVVRGAFSRTELTEPARIAAYFARPDWTAIVQEWRTGHTRQIRHVVKRFDQPVLEQSLCPRSSASDRPSFISTAAREISSLQLRIEAVLPRRIRKHTANCLVLLRVLEREPTVLWSVEGLKAAVEQARRDCNAKFPLDKLRECLTALAAHDLISQSGEVYRHKPRL